MNLIPAAVFGAVGGVIVQGDDFLVAGLGDPTGVVLETKVCVIGGEGEVGLCAAQPPDDGAVSAVDFVDGTGVPCGDEVVA